MRITVQNAVIAAILSCSAPYAAAAGERDTVLQLDPSVTTVAFTLGDVFHTVRGTFKLKHGEIRFDPATGAAAGEIVVDAASGESGSGARDRKMHRSVLESGRYPEIVFTADRVDGKVAPAGTSEVRVHGIFTIHGAAHETVVPVKVRTAPDQVAASARFDVPYVAWGMKNPSTLFLRVSDKVAIEITTLARVPLAHTTSVRP
jgi:polyisoprenoid-binding protein YceI